MGSSVGAKASSGRCARRSRRSRPTRRSPSSRARKGASRHPPDCTRPCAPPAAQVEAQQSIKPWELPRWVAGQASGLGLELEPDAARALIQHVGERQQRLRRELEKLALEFGPGTQLAVEQIEELTAPSGERKLWALADAVVAGEAQTATQLYVTLRAQGERVPGIVYWMVQRVAQAVEVAERLERGEPPAQVKRGLRMPSRAADRLIADARRVGAEELRRALEQLADLEYASRGGGPGGASEDAAVVRAIERIAG